MAAEQLRRLLLKEMGITSWFPRSPLPGAALSHEQCLQNFLDDGAITDASVMARPNMLDSSAPAPVAHAASAPATGSRQQRLGGFAADQAARAAGSATVNPAMAQLTELLGKTPATTVPAPAQLSDAVPSAFRPSVSAPSVPAPRGSGSAVPPTPGQAVPDPEAHAQESAQNRAQSVATASPAQQVDDFGFSWFNVDKRLAVLAMLPAGNTRLTASCRQMLARMLAALHTPWQTLELGEQSFHWPFADDLGLPVDAAAARQAVDGFVARRLREQNCATLLVLSDGLPWFFQQSLAGSENGADSHQLRVHRQFGFAMLATHSLHAMEKDAGLKRDAWQAMQLLRERLNRNN